MDRYHLAWLMVGKSVLGPRGRPMSEAETIVYVRDVADQKTAALRMSLKAVEEQNMPFLGEAGALTLEVVHRLDRQHQHRRAAMGHLGRQPACVHAADQVDGHLFGATLAVAVDDAERDLNLVVFHAEQQVWSCRPAGNRPRIAIR